MLNSLRAAARFFQEKVGWNRIGVVLSVAIAPVDNAAKSADDNPMI